MSDLDRLTRSLADRYRIERELGVGGMATVYLAHDLRHERSVALKVLRAELAAVIGAERFLGEIKTTANLQHPHILPLFDSGNADGFLYYVMPYVEGESLRDRLTREKQLPVEEAVRIAEEVAEALEYAHRQGVIHRDIKPENILLHGGHALVADFGIALAVTKIGGSRMTETGMSLGTPSYMAPEQAMGEREITPRADVYALGCVLFEMLLGEPPFTGPTAQAVVAKVMTEKPGPIVARRERVPAHLESAVFTALEKLPADRFGSAAAFAAALARPVAAPPARATARRSRVAALRWLPIAALLVAGFVAGRALGGPRAPAPMWTGELLGGPDVALAPAVSRDGQMVAFEAMVNGQTQLAVLKPESGDWKVLTSDRTRGLVATASWSRDNSRIYYDRYLDVPNGVFSVSPLGGEERLVLANAMYPDVLPDGTLLVARLNADRDLQLYRFWPESGRLDTLNAVGTTDVSVAFFRAFPDGKEVAFFGRPAGLQEAANHLYAIDLATNRARRLVPDSGFSNPAWLSITPDGRWVVMPASAGSLTRVLAVARDGSDEVRVLASITGTAYNLDVGPDGSLYFDQASRSAHLFRYPPTGGKPDVQPLPPPLPSLALTSSTELLPLPDGRVLVTALAGRASRVMVVAPGHEATPFLVTSEPSDGPLALVGRDLVALRVGVGPHRTIAIARIASGQVVHRLSGLNPESVAGSPDGKTLYYTTASRAVWAVPIAGGQPRRIRNGDGVAADPGGRYLVIDVNDTGQVRLYRVPVDGGPETEIPVHSEMRLAAGVNLTSNAVGADGRIVVQVVPRASWFWPSAILDPRTGNLTVLESQAGDDERGGWGPDGRVVCWALGLQARLWRLRPVGGKRYAAEGGDP